MVMKCANPFCGHVEGQSGAQFCGICGARLVEGSYHRPAPGGSTGLTTQGTRPRHLVKGGGIPTSHVVFIIFLIFMHLVVIGCLIGSYAEKTADPLGIAFIANGIMMIVNGIVGSRLVDPSGDEGVPTAFAVVISYYGGQAYFFVMFILLLRSCVGHF